MNTWCQCSTPLIFTCLYHCSQTLHTSLWFKCPHRKPTERKTICAAQWSLFTHWGIHRHVYLLLDLKFIIINMYNKKYLTHWYSRETICKQQPNVITSASMLCTRRTTRLPTSQFTYNNLRTRLDYKKIKYWIILQNVIKLFQFSLKQGNYSDH